MKTNIIILVIILMIMQSCKVYQEMPLKEVDNKGKALFVNKSGQKFYFKNIIQKDGVYYGIQRKDSLEIPQFDPHHVLKHNDYKVRVKLNERNKVVTGYLHEVKDTSVVVSSWSGKSNYGVRILDQYQELGVEDIDKIDVSNPSLEGKGASVGAAIGVGTGIVVGALMTVYLVVPGAIALGIVGGASGLVAASNKETIEIHGSLDQYNINRQDLQLKSIVVEQSQDKRSTFSEDSARKAYAKKMAIAKNAAMAKNVIHASFSHFVYPPENYYSISYDRRIWKSLWATAEIGTFVDEGKKVDVKLTTILGSKSSHVEFAAGIAYVSQKYEEAQFYGSFHASSYYGSYHNPYLTSTPTYQPFLPPSTVTKTFYRVIPAMTIGYRYQKPEGGFVFRAGIGFGSVDVSLGYSF